MGQHAHIPAFTLMCGTWSIVPVPKTASNGGTEGHERKQTFKKLDEFLRAIVILVLWRVVVVRSGKGRPNEVLIPVFKFTSRLLRSTITLKAGGPFWNIKNSAPSLCIKPFMAVLLDTCI